MAQPGTSKSRAWLWILLAVIAIAVIYLVSHSHSAVPVRAARVARQDLVSSVSTNGKVEPIEDFQAHAPSAGVVDKLFVHLGEQVERGQQLIQMDATDAASKVASAEASLQASSASLMNMEHGGTQSERLTQQADLTAAQTEVRQAATSLASLKKLQAQGAASANEVALAQQHLTTAQARVAQLQAQEHNRYGSVDLSAQRAQVAESRSALSAAQSDYAGVDVRAPFAGTVYALPVAQYDFVEAGEALLNIADLNHLRIRAYFDEPEIGSLAAGQPVTITWPAKPNQVWHGHVEQAPTTIITYGTRNVGECLITVDDAHGDLLPNTNVTVKVTTLQRFNVLSLPREALHTDGAVNFVYKIVDDRLVRAPVQVGVVNLTRVEIAGGLKEGDLVALSATTEVDLTEGLKVKVVE
ncbi:MAG TPA: efflux RND transporter periplasmic adaptor subunit [Acidobacteriaceae bacterium]|jgi:HlyD family secretion protein|nr:efflux RND transporter periplasmic adaptor subunit [Acidobacteriaceae bacterium]